MVSIAAHHFYSMTDTKLTPEERERYNIVHACSEGDITNAEAAARLHLKVRQVQKLKRAVEKHGERGVVHGNHSRAPWNATPVNIKNSVVAFLKRKNHRDSAPTFAIEQLIKQKKIALSRETVRAIMAGNNLWKAKKRTGPAIHRQCLTTTKASMPSSASGLTTSRRTAVPSLYTSTNSVRTRSTTRARSTTRSS